MTCGGDALTVLSVTAVHNHRNSLDINRLTVHVEHELQATGKITGSHTDTVTDGNLGRTVTAVLQLPVRSGRSDRTDCTLVFSVGQALLAAKAGATYVSPFVGRLDDICENGVALVAEIVRMYRYYGYDTQVLAASIRHTQHIVQCVEAGADVATCPLAAIKGLLKHPLTDIGLAQFLADHAKVNS